MKSSTNGSNSVQTHTTEFRLNFLGWFEVNIFWSHFLSFHNLLNFSFCRPAQIQVHLVCKLWHLCPKRRKLKSTNLWRICPFCCIPGFGTLEVQRFDRFFRFSKKRLQENAGTNALSWRLEVLIWAVEPWRQSRFCGSWAWCIPRFSELVKGLMIFCYARLSSGLLKIRLDLGETHVWPGLQSLQSRFGLEVHGFSSTQDWTSGLVTLSIHAGDSA